MFKQGEEVITPMVQYYECHITLDGDREQLQSDVEAINWKFSAIDGDPVLGAGVKCYATKHYNERLGQRDVVNLLLDAGNKLKKRGVTVTRQKVELVIYDDRSTKVSV